jgi:septal ring factor EnvC (AmiA/AmiB activator)
MKKNLIILVVFFTTLFSQNIEVKEQQLNNLRNQIDQTQKNLEQTKKRKSKAQKNRKSFKNKINSNQKKIEEMRSSEEESKKSISETNEALMQIEHRITNIEELCFKEFQKLMILETQKKQRMDRRTDCTILAELIHQTIDKYEEELDNRYSLTKKKKRHEKAWKDAQWTRIVTAKKNRKYKRKMSDLDSQIKKLSKQEKEFRNEKKQLEQNSRELAELIANLKLNQEEDTDFSYKFSSTKLDWPIKGKILRGYGKHKNSNYNVSIVNNGINIEAPIGAEVKAVDSGVVAFAERYGNSGKLIIIDHQNGFHSLYAHNSRLLVSKGNKIKKNQKIALAGNSGSVEVSQLHFEIRKRGKPVDPKLYLK